IRIEPLGGLHQADDARRDQVVDLDVGGEPAREPARDLLDVGKELSGVLVAAREQILFRVAPGGLLGGTGGRRLALRCCQLRGRLGACPPARDMPRSWRVTARENRGASLRITSETVSELAVGAS